MKKYFNIEPAQERIVAKLESIYLENFQTSEKPTNYSFAYLTPNIDELFLRTPKDLQIDNKKTSHPSSRCFEKTWATSTLDRTAVEILSTLNWYLI